MLEGEAMLAPPHVLTLIDMWAELVDVEGVVPIDHVLAHIVSLLVVSSHPSVTVRFDVERMRRVPRTEDVLECISLFELQVVHADEFF